VTMMTMAIFRNTKPPQCVECLAAGSPTWQLSKAEGIRRGAAYVALSAATVDDGLTQEHGLTKYEDGLVHRAPHYRKVPKRKGRHVRVLVQKPVGMAAGAQG
jgi:hypothetical protein